MASTKDYYQDQASVALTGTFVSFPFGFHANMVIICCDGGPGDSVSWSFGGTTQGGKLLAGEKVIFDRSLPGIASISLKGLGSYRLEVVGK